VKTIIAIVFKWQFFNSLESPYYTTCETNVLCVRTVFFLLFLKLLPIESNISECYVGGYIIIVMRCLFAVYTAVGKGIANKTTLYAYIQSGPSSFPVLNKRKNREDTVTTLYIYHHYNIIQYAWAAGCTPAIFEFIFWDVFIIFVVVCVCNAHAISRNPSSTLTQCVGYGRRRRRRAAALSSRALRYILN